MRPDQLSDYRTPSDPRLHPDGVRAAFVVTTINLAEDRYDRQIWLWDGQQARPLTSGPSDSAPRWSPDGSRLAFLRKAEGNGEAPQQVAVLPIDGGEAEVITDFGLGVRDLAWSPEGTKLAVVAGEYTDEWKDLEDDEHKRRPRRITRLPYRFDNLGWLHDRRAHVWVVDPSGDGDPVCVTPGDYNESAPVWSRDGKEIAFLSARHETRGLDDLSQLWTVGADGGTPRAVTAVGLWGNPSLDRTGRLHVLGSNDPHALPDVYPLWRIEDDGSLTCLTADLDRNLVTASPALSPGGPQWLDDGSFVTTLEDEGRVRIIHRTADGSTDEIIGGDRAVVGIDPRPDGSAAVFVATAPTDPGELWWWEHGSERKLTSLNEAFRATTDLAEPQRFTIDHEGVSVEGWVYLPPGEESAPLLLNIHGGPAAQYGYAFFDEFQVYAAAGYGVVATNPRGSHGYGSEHVRAVVGTWQEPVSPDLRDLLAAADTAAAAFPRLDTERMGIMGGSYGGFATVRVTALDHRYRSAVAERGVYAWTTFAGTSDIGPWFGREYLGTDPPEGWDVLWEGSPLAHAHLVATPTLVLHSESDWRCPIEQAEQLFSLLLRNGVETELVRFPHGEGHELSRSGSPKHRVERFEAILDWHARHLG